MSYVVADKSQGASLYFSLLAGRKIGSRTGAWVPETLKALQFQREKDAQSFADAYLANLTHLDVVRIGDV